MGAARKSVHVCEQCGHTETRWMGRCSQCGGWNTLVEQAAPTRNTTRARGGGSGRQPVNQPIPIHRATTDSPERRLSTGVVEVDRVLGGGVVPGSLILLGGEPGVGKSTLLLQTLAGLARQAQSDPAGVSILYVSGEESLAQTAMRGRRIGVDSASIDLLAETNLESILGTARRMKPTVLAVDSIQTVHTDLLDSIPGSVGQVRECTARLQGFAKGENIATVIVGHVTKDGSFAGPKTLQHVVDAALHFEGEGASPYRILRATKNRFGSTQEIGVFEMRTEGLVEVHNPSQQFLAERPLGAPGSAVVASAEGSRPILVEVQALVAPPAASVGRRVTAGVDGNRVALLLAVLAQRAGRDLIGEDVFVNVAGGMKLGEPAIDLGVACAMVSAANGRPIAADTVFFGEVGLAGEIRAVPMAEQRLSEAAKLGFARAIVPKQNAKQVGSPHGIELMAISTLEDALDLL